MSNVGPIGRLGRWSATHGRIVAAIWIVLVVGLGALAPRVESALSGAGWEDSGSESVQVRETAQDAFQGNVSSALTVVVASETVTIDDPAFQQTVARVEEHLEAHDSIASVTPPSQAAGTISADSRTAIVLGGAADDPTGMVRAADDMKGELSEVAAPGTTVSVTGASGMWSDFNEANKEAMLKSELLSWPVTLAILIVAFGALIAAGLPLLLTILSLAASAGSLVVAAQLFDVSIWAMNFALMFALALGIDYALFIVVRFRAALLGSKLSRAEAAAITMDTAGKAVLFSGLTVLIALSAVMLVPSPAFRSMALGIMLSVVFVLGATLTLLPAVLAKLGTGVNRFALPWVHEGEHRSARFAHWGARLWSKPALYGIPALVALLVLAAPVLGLRTGMPSIAVVPSEDSSRVGYEQVVTAFGPGAPGQLQLVGPAADMEEAQRIASADPGIAQASPPQTGADGFGMVQAVPRMDPSDPELGQTVDRLRDALPADVLLGGAAAENYDLETALNRYTPLVIGVVLALGFVLLLLAFQAPLVAAIGVITSLLATAAAFGVARLIFQEGHLSGLLGFESQGFLDAWGPVFFFAMIFAISMDYTVFLLSSAKEHWDSSHDAREAMIGGLAHSGRVVLAAAAVMVAVFFTFALSGPLPPKEMGVILGVAVLLDALLVRLLLMPVAMRLAGRAAWWRPVWVAKALPEVKFGH
ncbi:MAG: MMPL family transporter [Thermoleophilia bacterium]|nr:MMPL family transporter [Thermoleophilia bacterium]MDH3724881.1 MMPL family transporter [Thermoleophilia bacterium]